MARRTVPNRWFVSVEMPSSSRRIAERARQTRTFPTEVEAKQYAREMLFHGKKIVAGTLLGVDQSSRRIISGWQLHRWISE